MKIYEIPAMIRRALENVQVDDETGEILNALDLQEVESSAQEKVAGTAKYIREQEAEIEAMAAAMDAIKRRMTAKKNRIEYFKKLTKNAILELGTVETPDIKVSLRRTERVEVIDEDAICDLFMTVKTTKTVNKKALKDAIKAGEFIAGAEIVTDYSLQIK